MRHSLTRKLLEGILRNENVDELGLSDIMDIVRNEPGLSDFKPEPDYQVDPRTGDRIIYNAARAKRPHENPEAQGAEPEGEDLNATPSIISQGKTTGVIDVAPLSEGFTFINMNLFPILYPQPERVETPTVEIPGTDPLSPAPRAVRGCHLLQWTSSYQDRDWYNMPIDDCCIVLKRLACLERTLLKADSDAPVDGQSIPGYVSVIKNCGRLVGGSIAHGHQQIAYSTILPRRNRDLLRFADEQGTLFSNHMIQTTHENLVIKDYGEALLVVPYFMRRPYDMLLLIKNTQKKHLHELDAREIRAVAQGWQDGIRAMRAVLTGLGRQIAYNLTVNSGPGTGLFIEFLPYTQEMGGFEHLGLFVCQSTPDLCADYLKELLNKPSQTKES